MLETEQATVRGLNDEMAASLLSARCSELAEVPNVSLLYSLVLRSMRWKRQELEL